MVKKAGKKNKKRSNNKEEAILEDEPSATCFDKVGPIVCLILRL